MYDKENQRATHLLILLCYTFFTVVLTGESILLGWDTGAVVLLLLGLIVSWGLHITGKVSESGRMWLYFIMMMLAFFFYGIHETSIYDLAPVMIVAIIMCSATEMYSIIWLCVATYFLTMLYDFVFVLGGDVELTPLSVTRTLLHFALVCMAGYLARLVIGKRRRERAETDEKIAKLEEINRRTEDFLTNVSHELRTPINAVTGITAVMLKNEENDSRRKDIISIQNAGHRLFRQIEDILDYTEIDTGRIKVSEDTYMISSLMNDIITGNRMQAKEHTPEVIFDIDAGIPSVLLGDAKKIKKIIRHLIDNSIKFTKKGGVYVRIYALNKPYGINLCIRVSDTGVGIEESDLRKITEKFYQSSRGRNRRAGGLGLGLSIVHGLVEAMEGFMQIESAVGSGTTVSVSIPQKVSDSSPSMEIEDKSGLCLAAFLRPEKYEVPEVRNYYDEMISHMVQGLDVPLHRVTNIGELEKLISMYELTHLFIGKEEYEESKSYFEALDKNINVIAVADESFVLPAGSRVKLLRKPFYCFPVVGILNGGTAKNADSFEERRIICPGLKVLVVDDEPMNLIVAEGIFKDYQMRVKTAESGRKAIELCQKEDFDLIFLDHMMPEMDGVETLKRLRKIHADSSKALTVIAFTANAVSGAREMFLREGFDEFVSKPIDTLELDRVLKKVLPKSLIVYADENYKKSNMEQNTDGQEAVLEESTEVQEEEKSLKDDKTASLEAAGINMENGLQYCRGDMDFYFELLAMFAQDEKRKSNEIDNFYNQQDMDNYRILVHALKSSSKMIGADTLSEMARNAEDAAKNYDREYIASHHEELLSEYRRVSHCISEALDSDNGSDGQDFCENSAELSLEDLMSKLNELSASLDTFEADKAEALISEMSGAVFKGTSVAKLLGEIKTSVEDFELGAAADKLEELIGSLERGEA